MINTQVVALGIRLFCVWLAVYILRDVPGLWLLNAREFSNSGAAPAIVLVTVLFTAIIVALWIFPLTIARKLLPRAAANQPAAIPTANQLESTGFCLLGFWLLTRAIPDLIFEAFVFYQYTRPGSMLGLRPEEYAALAEHLIEFALGIWALFGAKGLLGIVLWARTAGSGAASTEEIKRDA